MKKLLSILLLLCMLAVSLVGCKVGNSSDTTVGTVDTAIGDDEDRKYIAELPELNYDGEIVRMASRDKVGFSDEFYTDGLEGAVSTAVFKRNSKVEETLGVKLEVTPIKDLNANTHSTVIETVEKEIMSGSPESFDLVAAPALTVPMGVGMNLFANLNDLEYVNLSKLYWAQGYNEYFSAGNQQYTATGAATLTVYRFMYITVINTKVLEDNKIDSIYNVVKEGKWTLEYQANLAKMLYADENGDGECDIDDQYGFVSGARTSVDSYWTSTNTSCVTKSTDNYFLYSMNQERISNMVDKMLNLYYDCGGSYIIPATKDGTDNTDIVDVFSRNKTAMATMMINTLETQLKDHKLEYEIAPMPKYDEDQQRYYSHVQDQVTVLCIPITKTGDRLQMLGAVMECMAYEGYRELYTSYFENILPYRYLQSNESAEMLDLVYECIDFSFVGMHNVTNVGWSTMLRSMARDEINLTSSMLASSARNAAQSVEEFNAIYRELSQKQQ